MSRVAPALLDNLEVRRAVWRVGLELSCYECEQENLDRSSSGVPVTTRNTQFEGNCGGLQQRCRPSPRRKDSTCNQACFDAT